MEVEETIEAVGQATNDATVSTTQNTEMMELLASTAAMQAQNEQQEIERKHRMATQVSATCVW